MNANPQLTRGRLIPLQRVAVSCPLKCPLIQPTLQAVIVWTTPESHRIADIRRTDFTCGSIADASAHIADEQDRLHSTPCAACQRYSLSLVTAMKKNRFGNRLSTTHVLPGPFPAHHSTEQMPSDNGPKFIAAGLREWLAHAGIVPLSRSPGHRVTGSPTGVKLHRKFQQSAATSLMIFDPGSHRGQPDGLPTTHTVLKVRRGTVSVTVCKDVSLFYHTSLQT